MGAPSLNFVRKLYNKINYKQEQLEEVRKIEETLQREFNGDLKAAYNQAKNEHWAPISEDQLEELKKKEVLKDSIKDHMAIFNMYK